MSECDSCGDPDAEQCPKSRRPCGHHCNHSWSHDECCWCGKTWGGNPPDLAGQIRRRAEHDGCTILGGTGAFEMFNKE